MSLGFDNGVIGHQTTLRRAAASNLTDTGFPSKIPTVTQPSGGGVFAVANANGEIRNAILLMPFGTGSENDTFKIRVYGWDKAVDESATDLWIPCLLCDLTCTLSTIVGVANAVVIATERFADTLSLTTGNEDVSIDIVSPTGNVPAHFVIDGKVFELYEVTIDRNSSATAANALWKAL